MQPNFLLPFHHMRFTWILFRNTLYQHSRTFIWETARPHSIRSGQWDQISYLPSPQKLHAIQFSYKSEYSVSFFFGIARWFSYLMAVLHMFRLISRCRVVRPIWMEFREMIRKNIWEFAVSEMFRLLSQAVNEDIFKVNCIYWTNVLLLLVSSTLVSTLSQSPSL